MHLAASTVYTPSAPSPIYSSNPQPDEHRLELTPRSPSRPRPTGKYVKEAKNITIILSEQFDDAPIPEYGRNALLNGEVLLNDTADILSVVLKVEGQLSLLISEGGSSTKPLVSDAYTMWKRDSPLNVCCPKTLSFACVLPSSFTDGQRSRPLPPSYKLSFLGVPGLFVNCSYTLTVSVTKTSNLGLWKRQKSLCTRLNYYPRTRPHRPILYSTFFSTVKSSPEEWLQVTSTMGSRPNSHLEPIQCHLFVPSVQIYGLADAIPFHIQLSAPASSLHEFCSRSSERPAQTSIFSTGQVSSQQDAKSSIRVFLLRQVCVEVRSQTAWRNCVLGEGKLRPLPPCLPSTDTISPEVDLFTLDWDGEVRCEEDITTGGFNTGNLIVKDFIVLSMTPPHPQTSKLIEHQHAHPIRLVTDPWVDLVVPSEERLR